MKNPSGYGGGGREDGKGMADYPAETGTKRNYPSGGKGGGRPLQDGNGPNEKAPAEDFNKGPDGATGAPGTSDSATGKNKSATYGQATKTQRPDKGAPQQWSADDYSDKGVIY